jgi:hypothetical protein
VFIAGATATPTHPAARLRGIEVRVTTRRRGPGRPVKYPIGRCHHSTWSADGRRWCSSTHQPRPWWLRLAASLVRRSWSMPTARSTSVDCPGGSDECPAGHHHGRHQRPLRRPARGRWRTCLHRAGHPHTVRGRRCTLARAEHRRGGPFARRAARRSWTPPGHTGVRFRSRRHRG